jgi:hypothetical protein
MATVQELARLRDMIAEVDDTDGWDDATLETYINQTLNTNGTTNLRAAAADVWAAKAAKFSELVDVTESSSSRRNSQIFEHARKMADSYAASAVDPGVVASRRTQSIAMRRPTRG